MRIALGADHAGFPLKEDLRAALEAQGHEIADFGTNSADSTDYPDYASAVAHAVADGAADRGILVCYTGVGMSIAANKVEKVRAAVAFDPEEVRLTRAHNNSNVLTIGAKFTGAEQARRYVEIFLNTPFEGGRHQRRVDKITEIEQQARTEGEKS
jgi:ribose 5-phosphate isomerase B